MTTRRNVRVVAAVAAAIVTAALAGGAAADVPVPTVAAGAATPRPAPAAPTQTPWLWLGPLIGALATIGGVVIANVYATRNLRSGTVQKTNELEIISIDTRLQSFIGPYQQLSAENKSLASELRRRHGGEAFRTLSALLQEGWLQGLGAGDRKLVEVVVENGRRLRGMILDNAGATSDTLLPYFAAATTHFRLLDLAHAGSLEPDPARFAGYVYPRQLDGVLQLERERLEARREKLRSEPDVAHGRMAELAIPPSLALDIPTSIDPGQPVTG